MATDSKALTPSADGAAMIEKVLIGGDLSKLSAAERLAYYQRVCESLGLNPFTKPFEYVNLSGKLVLYARKDATEQLRKLHSVSIVKLDTIYADDLVIVTATAQDRAGRTDSDVGAVSVGSLKGEARANAIMKATTKSKRRVTLSICGLGMLDETEVESVPGARVVPLDEESTSTAPAEDETARKRASAVKIQEHCQRVGRVVPQKTGQWIALSTELKMPAISKQDQMTAEWFDQVLARLQKADETALIEGEVADDEAPIGHSSAFVGYRDAIQRAETRAVVTGVLDDAMADIGITEDEQAELETLGKARYEALAEPAGAGAV